METVLSFVVSISFLQSLSYSYLMMRRSSGVLGIKFVEKILLVLVYFFFQARIVAHIGCFQIGVQGNAKAWLLCCFNDIEYK